MNCNKNRKDTILIVDDSEINRAILSDMLCDKYAIIEAGDGEEAIRIMKKNGSEISLVLLDIIMPKYDGYEVLSAMNKENFIRNIPVVMISAENAASSIKRAFDLGAVDYINRPFDVYTVCHRVKNTLQLFSEQNNMIRQVMDQIYDKERLNNMMITILSHIVEFRNGESGLHILHVNVITEILLKKLAEKTDNYHLNMFKIKMISLASSLHDIGKIAIPAEIMQKPGIYTEEEYGVMKQHSYLGAKMLQELPYHNDEILVQYAYEICRWHHERYDGKGYPDGLTGDKIPVSAQVVAMADTYDALVSERCYKKQIPHEQAVQMIVSGQCGMFNPLLVECLLECEKEIAKEVKVNSITVNAEIRTEQMIKDILRGEDVLISDRTLRLLEHEREKFQFFTSLSKDIPFEYSMDPPMLTLQGNGAQVFDLKEIEMNPVKSGAILSVLTEEQLDKLRNAIYSTSPENPMIQKCTKLKFKEGERFCKVVIRTMWSSEDHRKMTGFIGKLEDIHKEHMEIQELKHLARHDSLTGLLNHRTAHEQILERLEAFPDREFMLGIFDLDYFKIANDKYGHMFGDKVLEHIAHKLLENTRSSDIIARIGGDEFLIFMEYKEESEKIIHRIYHSLLGEYKGFSISLSMGVARTTIVGKEYEALFCSADKALYYVKQKGKGRYCFYDDSMTDMLSVLSSIDESEK